MHVLAVLIANGQNTDSAMVLDSRIDVLNRYLNSYQCKADLGMDQMFEIYRGCVEAVGKLNNPTVMQVVMKTLSGMLGASCKPKQFVDYLNAGGQLYHCTRKPRSVGLSEWRSLSNEVNLMDDGAGPLDKFIKARIEGKLDPTAARPGMPFTLYDAAKLCNCQGAGCGFYHIPVFTGMPTWLTAPASEEPAKAALMIHTPFRWSRETFGSVSSANPLERWWTPPGEEPSPELDGQFPTFAAALYDFLASPDCPQLLVDEMTAAHRLQQEREAKERRKAERERARQQQQQQGGGAAHSHGHDHDHDHDDDDDDEPSQWTGASGMPDVFASNASARVDEEGEEMGREALAAALAGMANAANAGANEDEDDESHYAGPPGFDWFQYARETLGREEIRIDANGEGATEQEFRARAAAAATASGGCGGGDGGDDDGGWADAPCVDPSQWPWRWSDDEIAAGTCLGGEAFLENLEKAHKDAELRRAQTAVTEYPLNHAEPLACNEMQAFAVSLTLWHMLRHLLQLKDLDEIPFCGLLVGGAGYGKSHSTKVNSRLSARLVADERGSLNTTPTGASAAQVFNGCTMQGATPLPKFKKDESRNVTFADKPLSGPAATRLAAKMGMAAPARDDDLPPAGAPGGPKTLVKQQDEVSMYACLPPFGLPASSHTFGLPASSHTHDPACAPLAGGPM